MKFHLARHHRVLMAAMILINHAACTGTNPCTASGLMWYQADTCVNACDTTYYTGTSISDLSMNSYLFCQGMLMV